MSAILYFWNRRWQSVAFDSETGQGNTRWFSRKPKRCPGFAYYHSGKWYALRLEGNDLVFQYGSDKWPLDGEEYRCTSTTNEAAMRIFTIYKQDMRLLRIQYKIPRFLLDDPTADVVDAEMTDFFFWVARVWNDSSYRSQLRIGWKNY